MTAVKFKVKKGDQVIVRAGSQKGKTGTISQVLKDKERVIVQGVNMVTRNKKPDYNNPDGRITKEASIHVSNVALVDPKTKTATRVGYRMEDGQKVRYAKSSGEKI